MRVAAPSILWMTVALLVPSASPAADDGFVSLFDGKTLNGWTVCCLAKDAGLGAKAWTVDRGTILANTMGHKEQFYIWLTTNKEYGDFVLRLRFQCRAKREGQQRHPDPQPLHRRNGMDGRPADRHRSAQPTRDHRQALE